MNKYLLSRTEPAVACSDTAHMALPSFLIAVAFDTDLLSIVAQAMLAAFACALRLVVWTGHE
jgi:hypothetical protein